MRLNNRGAKVVQFEESPEDNKSQRPSPTRSELANTINQERLKILKEQVQALKLSESNVRDNSEKYFEMIKDKFQFRPSKFNTISCTLTDAKKLTLVTLKKPMLIPRECCSSSPE